MSTWAIRSAHGPNGEVVQFRERPKPGHPGVLERIYDNPVERFSSPIGSTMQLLRPGDYRPRRTVTRSTPTSSEPKVLMFRSGFEDLWRSLPHRDVELGGAMFGAIDSKTVIIKKVTLDVRESQRGSCVLDGDSIDRRIAKHRQAGDALRFVGHWHNHPGHGDPIASRADLKSWMSYTPEGGEPFVGLIVQRPHPWFLGWKGAAVRAHMLVRTATGIDCARVFDLRQLPSTL